MSNLRICMLGGTGFVGRHLAQELVRRGHHVRILTRRREPHRSLLVLPNLELMESNIHYVSDLTAHCKGFDAVINLVGILNAGAGERSGFEANHVQVVENVLNACQFNGITRYLHMSALGADANGASEYLRSKGKGEDLAHKGAGAGIQVTSFRPSVIFGHDDNFFNQFGRYLRLLPFMPLACPDAPLSPVFVDDLAVAMANALTDPATYGQRYDLCGPKTYTLAELVRYTRQVLGLHRPVLGLGEGLSNLQARLMEWAPGKPLSRDNLASLRAATACNSDDLGRLGVQPTHLEAVVPGYLKQRGRTRLYDCLRVRAGRN